MRVSAAAIALVASACVSGAARAAPTYEIDLLVERPRDGDYGVVPDDALAKPLTLNIESENGAVALACVEEASLGRIYCAGSERPFTEPGRYRIVALPAAKASEGLWHERVDVPARASEVIVRGKVSLRYGHAGLSLSLVYSASDAAVSLSNPWIASHAEHQRKRNDALAFKLTNNSERTIFARGSGGVVHGRLFRLPPGGIERVRHGRDMCGDLWARTEISIRPGATVDVIEDLNGVWLESGSYVYRVTFSPSLPEDGAPLIVFDVSYQFEVR